MRIGELAERGDVSTKTIRYYESIGLLEEPPRTDGGYRTYGDEAVERLRFVRDAQATGLTLAEIASVLELKAAGARSCAHTTTLLERHLAEVDAQIEGDAPTRILVETPGGEKMRVFGKLVGEYHAMYCSASPPTSVHAVNTIERSRR